MSLEAIVMLIVFFGYAVIVFCVAHVMAADREERQKRSESEEDAS
jgi:hypothetical protein